MNTYEQIIAKLNKNNVKFNIIDQTSAKSRTIEDQVASTNMTFAEGLSTLFFVNERKEIIVILRRDDRSLVSGTIKKITNSKSLNFASEELINQLGYEGGLASPVLLEELQKSHNVRILVDVKSDEMTRVICGLAKDGYALEIQKVDLFKLIGNYQVVDITEPNAKRQANQLRILSGITPSSSNGLHLGNYLGAVKEHIEFQSKGECFYFVADLHALNTVYDPKVYSQNVLLTYMDYLALGIDITKTHFYVESLIPEISQLQTILNNVVMVSQMKRMHAFKDKIGNENAEIENVNMGLFNYPILMAADILLFEPDVIPVGADQSQHVEVCIDMAKSFNARYGKVLKVPKLHIKEATSKILGTDGVRKMSKSIGNAITIFADEKTLNKQIMSIVTDKNRIHPTDPGDPAKNVIFSYYRLLGYDERKLTDFEDRYRKGTVGDLEIKKEFNRYFLEYFADFRAKRYEIEKDQEAIMQLIKTQSASVREIAKVNLEKIRKAIGGIV